jgi:hypothetical protein
MTGKVVFNSNHGYSYEVAINAIWDNYKAYGLERGLFALSEADEHMKNLKKADPLFWRTWVAEISWREITLMNPVLTSIPEREGGFYSPFEAMEEAESSEVKTFILGNHLRGCFEGEFATFDEAWVVLSARFLKSFPSKNGLQVLMWVNEVNKYGFKSNALCREGVTSLEPVDEALIANCRSSFHRG